MVYVKKFNVGWMVVEWIQLCTDMLIEGTHGAGEQSKHIRCYVY